MRPPPPEGFARASRPKRHSRQLDFLPALLKSELQERLEAEGEWKLAARLDKCGHEVALMCVACGTRKPALTHCKAKWCPMCQAGVAARNKERVWPVVSRYQWPLHVTLTCRSTPTPEGLKLFKKNFFRFRDKKIFKSTVRGGVCGFEITHGEHGYHPHAHLIVDCRWLAIKTPEPNWKAHPDHVKAVCMKAHDELSKEWGKSVGQPRGAVVWVARTAVDTAVQEALKYSLKTDEILKMKGKIGPVIHALNSIRSMTTFGDTYGIGKKKVKAPCKCGNCGAVGTTGLESEIAHIIRKAWD